MILNRFNEVPYREVSKAAEDLLEDHKTAIDPRWLRFRLIDDGADGSYCSVYTNLNEVPLNMRRTIMNYAREQQVFRKVVIRPPRVASLSKDFGSYQLLSISWVAE